MPQKIIKKSEIVRNCGLIFLVGIGPLIAGCTSRVEIDNVDIKEVAFDPKLPVRDESEIKTYQVSLTLRKKDLFELVKKELNNHLQLTNCVDGVFIKSPDLYIDGIELNDFDNLRGSVVLFPDTVTVSGTLSARDISKEPVCATFVGGNYLLRRLRSNRVKARVQNYGELR